MLGTSQRTARCGSASVSKDGFAHIANEARLAEKPVIDTAVETADRSAIYRLPKDELSTMPRGSRNSLISVLKQSRYIGGKSVIFWGADIAEDTQGLDILGVPRP